VVLYSSCISKILLRKAISCLKLLGNQWMLEESENIFHRLNMELDLQSLFGLLCTAVIIG
jgi:hypothetical protein